MKKLLLMATMLLSFGAVKAQISDVQQKGSFLYVYGENNKQLSYLSIGSSDEYLGMGSSFFVVKKAGEPSPAAPGSDLPLSSSVFLCFLYSCNASIYL